MQTLLQTLMGSREQAEQGTGLESNGGGFRTELGVISASVAERPEEVTFDQRLTDKEEPAISRLGKELSR